MADRVLRDDSGSAPPVRIDFYVVVVLDYLSFCPTVP